MEENKYSITLDDGFVISDLRMNGNMFVSPIELDWDYIEEHLSHVVIYDGINSFTYGVMKFVPPIKKDNQYLFALCEIPEEELMYEKLRADVDYLSMMTLEVL